MTRWYKKDETSKRFSWFFIGNMLAAACSGLIAYGIDGLFEQLLIMIRFFSLHMRGVAGLAGWQWLFLLEGIFTVLVGIAFFVCFPDQVSNPVSLMGVRYFTEREAEILYKRVMIDDPSKAHAKRSVSWPELRSAVHPVNGAWVSANAKSAGERSITMAILIMAANCSGIVGKQLFREEDAPKYRQGWTVITGLTTVAVACGIWANVQYYILNKRRLGRTGLPYQY
ncbi:putative uncharacterized transporter YOL163W [Colletotrichum liriopes]|uniref:Uncharacterized transporter YOL163W n=1 Tax=Colletotrichum liriopes TaxID=708192 RepID=A0AA37GI68_9PEZI|nr:putative uncharacterized transporter YOL163W [Colletotrichum liriopes]